MFAGIYSARNWFLAHNWMLFLVPIPSIAPIYFATKIYHLPKNRHPRCLLLQAITAHSFSLLSDYKSLIPAFPNNLSILLYCGGAMCLQGPRTLIISISIFQEHIARHTLLLKSSVLIPPENAILPLFSSNRRMFSCTRVEP